MKLRNSALMALLVASTWLTSNSGMGSAQSDPPKEAYLKWTPAEIEKVGNSMRVNGRVGGKFDFRVIHTEHSYNYKLRATWLTPEVIRASARLEQLRMRLTDDQTRAIVADADEEIDTCILVEIDPREGSGVIPLDWRAILQPVGTQVEAIVGTSAPELRMFKALAGIARRDYAYDIFWLYFPLTTETGEPLIPSSAKEVELLVGIYNKQGSVRWPVPDSVREKATRLGEQRKKKHKR